MSTIEMKNIRSRILRLALPAIMEMMLQTLVWTADTAMVGRLTPAAISSVNLGSQIMFTISNIFGALGIGATAMVSRHIGGENKKRAEQIGSQSIGIGIIISLIIGVTGIITSKMIFKNIVSDKEVISLGTEYLKIVFIGIIFLIPLMISNAVLRGSGNAVAPLISACFANVINIVGDYVLIFGKFGFPKMGVRGAAIATAFSQAIGFFITLSFLLRGKSSIKLHLKNIFNFNIKDMKSIIKLSAPATFEMTMNEGSRLISSFWVAQLGTLAFAGHSLASSAESISYMPAYGFAIAATTMVGQSLGANRTDHAEISTKQSIKYSCLLVGVVGLAFLLVPYSIMRLFSNNLEAVKIASRCLRVGALEQIPIAIAMVTSGALKGAGDTKGPFKIALAINLGLRLPLIFITVFVIKGRIEYVWLATAIQYIAEAIFMTIRYRRGKWKSISI
ncbi:MATE efflux family protein [Gottschalkia purinilytica]|uniref:Probable multidrug resistance protein NorM n=1 Tax=Gottschalkia purinilytica TaxID=1503 RepID=A0A0L0W8I1_GOTPU|nr:MATE family efflux transporter [Gottschalkia purinilytica]KNF07854.1 MATE efflux family protein [Gottschalkia purinilytica]